MCERGSLTYENENQGNCKNFTEHGELKIRQEKKRKPKTQKRIKIWKLKGDKIIEFQEKVREKQVPETETGQENWQSIKSAILEAAEEVCGTTKGRRYQGRETSWWTPEVQEAIRRKKVAFKAWQRDRDEDLREAYKEAKREAKRAVAKDKEEAWREWYEKMETKEGERIIYKVAKQRAQSRQDVGEECPPVEGPLSDINEKEVEEAMKKMKSGRATGCPGLPVDLLEHLGKEGIQMVTSLLQRRKGDPVDCGNFRGIKLLEHVMKILEKVIEGRIRGLVSVNDIQFGFGPGRGTMDAAFIIIQQQDKHLEVNRDLYYTFMNLEKAYDRIPRDLVYLPQTAKSPRETDKDGLPWELLFADDLVVVTDSEEELQRRCLRRQIGMESKGLKVSTKKTEVMASSRRDVEVNIKDKNNARLKQVQEFKYLE
ncbi:uncharacterized protein LOC125043700 [Penaeus chinensis]|uniref:uncharacterized protein LOC125043700 n=1 Tax=Penaeus chinensis TaxID=139456 RepID=UPI001FB58915|nr:uncharacterized protein LOC125043700 [Penaeus chinensis]